MMLFPWNVDVSGIMTKLFKFIRKHRKLKKDCVKISFVLFRFGRCSRSHTSWIVCDWDSSLD